MSRAGRGCRNNRVVVIQIVRFVPTDLGTCWPSQLIRRGSFNSESRKVRTYSSLNKPD
jgi:hypothetical protein